MAVIPRQILIDADGTCWFHEYPYIGDPVPGAIEVLKELESAGHTLILHTMRHDELLEEAEEWFLRHDIHITYSNCNPTQETGSRKVYGHISIDDHNLGIPLKYIPENHHKPYVDWDGVKKLLKERQYL